MIYFLYVFDFLFVLPCTFRTENVLWICNQLFVLLVLFTLGCCCFGGFFVLTCDMFFYFLFVCGPLAGFFSIVLLFSVLLLHCSFPYELLLRIASDSLFSFLLVRSVLFDLNTNVVLLYWIARYTMNEWGEGPDGGTLVASQYFTARSLNGDKK